MPNVNDMGFLETLQDSAQRTAQAETPWIDSIREDYERVSQQVADMLAMTAGYPMNHHTRARVAAMMGEVRRLKSLLDLY